MSVAVRETRTTPESPATACPICASAGTRECFGLYDDRFGYPGAFRLRACSVCGHRYLVDAEFSDQKIQRLYSDYYPRKSMKVEDFRPHAERNGIAAWLDGAKASAFRWVPRSVRVLDIGSGFGQALGYHTNRGCEAWGVESDENALRVAERHGFNVRIGVFQAADFPAEYFDVVTMDQVIEHMRDPVATMASVCAVLKPGGVAILSTPNAKGWGARVFGRRWINWHAPYHLHFFTHRSMGEAARQAGLGLRCLGTTTPSDWLHYQLIHLATHPRRGEASPFWTGRGGYGLSQRTAMKLASILHRLHLTHVVTRAMDAAQVGDSQLFLLSKP
jgi:2-polyprenyl-3-methyl-5-hydroxy-6-metoxy-1,4-benzoquinol methylase